MKENFFKKVVFGMLRDENRIERTGGGGGSGHLVRSGTLMSYSFTGTKRSVKNFYRAIGYGFGTRQHRQSARVGSVSPACFTPPKPLPPSTPPHTQKYKNGKIYFSSRGNTK
jgi:hypothetical protein